LTRCIITYMSRYPNNSSTGVPQSPYDDSKDTLSPTFLGGPAAPLTARRARQSGPGGTGIPMDLDELGQVSASIIKMEAAVERLRINLVALDEPDDIYENLKKQELLKSQLDTHKKTRYALQLRRIAAQASFSFSPEGIETIIDTCNELGSLTAVIAAFSSSVSISILFSGIRGNLFYFFVSWWCSIIALTTGLGLSVVSSRKTKSRDTATDVDWWRVHLGGFVVGLCLLASVGSIVCMCYASMTLNVSNELAPDDGAPSIAGGPSIPNGVPIATMVVASIIIIVICGGAFIALFLGPFRFSTKRHWTVRRDRKMEEARRQREEHGY